MEQCLHLLVIDPNDNLVLTDWHQGRWLLPVFSGRERARIGPLAKELITRRGIGGQVVGQWLGRVSAQPDVVDWIVVARTRSGRCVPGASAWAAPLSLCARSSVVEYQQWALEKMLAGSDRPRVPGPFGHPEWLDGVRAWLEAVAGALNLDDAVMYRLTAYTVVMKLPTSSGAFYFKGLGSHSASEAALTLALSRLAPDSFARTRALGRGPEGEAWWLTEECPGATLASAPTTEGAALVAEAWGRIQRELSDGVLDRLTSAELEPAAEWSCALVRTLGTGRDIDHCCDRIHLAFDAVAHAAEPVAWIPLDLDPSNVVVHDGCVRFIDLDESYRGPGPLAAATFARRFRRLMGGGVGAEAVGLIYTAYELGLRSLPFAPQLWQAFEVVSIVLEIQAGWRRILGNLARAELHGPLELIERRVAQRLLRAVSIDRARTAR